MDSPSSLCLSKIIKKQLKSGYWGITLQKIPQGSWNADMYTNWMTQNGVNIYEWCPAHAIMGIYKH